MLCKREGGGGVRSAPPPNLGYVLDILIGFQVRLTLCHLFRVLRTGLRPDPTMPPAGPGRVSGPASPVRGLCNLESVIYSDILLFLIVKFPGPMKEMFFIMLLYEAKNLTYHNMVFMRLLVIGFIIGSLFEYFISSQMSVILFTTLLVIFLTNPQTTKIEQSHL